MEKFLGGRPGYSKEVLFFWLLVKKTTCWDYRTVASMAGVSHPTLIRANEFFILKGIYQKVFVNLVKSAYKQGLIRGKYVAMDSSLAHDGTLAVPLLKKARPWLKKVGYVLTDKGYDDTDIVNWIVKELEAKAAIPMRAKSKLAKGKVNRYGNLANWKLKAKGRTFKKSIYNKRSSVERTFSVLKRTYHLGKEELKGILNFGKQVYLALISYMLKKLKIVGVVQV